MLRAALTFVLLCLNLALWGTPIFLGGLVKLFLPGKLRRRWILTLVPLADRWTAGNDRIVDLMLPTKWDIQGAEHLSAHRRYVVIGNHISAVDIVAIFRTFHDRSAFVRFFLKSELLWFPILGQACWALEFPFMKRHSPRYIEKHPEKRREDLETTRRLCRRYATIPVTVMNFVEGTRFTERKRISQNSPFRHLLNPRAGGLSFAFASFGEQLDAVLDVTIAYPGHDISMWQFLRGKIPQVVVRVREIALPEEFKSAAVAEPGPVRERFKEWLTQLWTDKDQLLGQLLNEPAKEELLPKLETCRKSNG